QQAIAMGLVLDLQQTFEDLQQLPGLRRVVAAALELGDDLGLSFDMRPAERRGAFGLGQVPFSHLAFDHWRPRAGSVCAAMGVVSCRAHGTLPAAARFCSRAAWIRADRQSEHDPMSLLLLIVILVLLFGGGGGYYGYRSGYYGGGGHSLIWLLV